MITITKSMVALSALISAGLVGVFDMTGSRADDQAAALQIAQRFPVTSEMFTPVSLAYFVAQKFIEQQQAEGRKADKLPMSECAQQGWPSLSPNCLVASDGSPVRKVTRVVTIERRVGDNTSELVRMPVADLAQR